MAGISFGGINTGLPPNLVEQIIEAEKQPIKSMQAAKGKSESKLKLVTDLETKVGDIRKGLSELASARGFSDIKLTSGDPNVLSGTVDAGASKPGSWNLEVVKLAEKAGAMTNGFPDKDKTQIAAIKQLTRQMGESIVRQVSRILIEIFATDFACQKRMASDTAASGERNAALVRIRLRTYGFLVFALGGLLAACFRRFALATAGLR